MKRTRIQPATRKTQILAAAVNLAKEEGLAAVNLSSVARRMGNIQRTGLSHYYNIDELLAAVVVQAVAEGNLKIIGWAVVKSYPQVKDLPDALKVKALQSLAIK